MQLSEKEALESTIAQWTVIKRLVKEKGIPDDTINIIESFFSRIYALKWAAVRQLGYDTSIINYCFLCQYCKISCTKCPLYTKWSKKPGRACCENEDSIYYKIALAANIGDQALLIRRVGTFITKCKRALKSLNGTPD